MSEEERWVSISGYEGLYEVSDKGNIKNIVNNKLLNIRLDRRNGYRSVKLTKDKIRKNYFIHRLVYLSFNNLSLTDKGIIDHIDTNRSNNNLDNLRYCESRKENMNNPITKSNISRTSKRKHKKPNFNLIDLPGEAWSNEIESEAFYYSISNFGRVKKRYKTKLAEINTRFDGYQTVSIGQKNKLLHRVIWEAFNGPIPEGYQIDHIDSNKSNNNLDNLRLVSSQKENMQNEETKKKLSKPIYQIDKDTNEILREFDSLIEAKKWIIDNKLNDGSGKSICGNISESCNNKNRQTAYGYKWKYK